MRVAITLMLVVASGIAPLALAQGDTSKPPQLSCHIGPLTRTYGQVDWLVYSCSDNRSLVFVSAPGSPAMPFVFSLIADARGRYRLSGEGTGNKEATSAAFAELKVLSAQDVSDLIDMTKAAKK
jgi:hypothetical protein